MTQIETTIAALTERINALTAKQEATDSALIKALANANPDNVRALGQGLKAQIRSEAETMAARLAVNIAAQAGVPPVEESGGDGSEGRSTDDAHAAHMKRLNRFHGTR